MSKRKIVVGMLGIIVASLGLLWFLQGSDLVHVKPILCFANCVPLTGRSLTWQVVGSVTTVIGAVIAYVGLKR